MIGFCWFLIVRVTAFSFIREKTADGCKCCGWKGGGGSVSMLVLHVCLWPFQVVHGKQLRSTNVKPTLLWFSFGYEFLFFGHGKFYIRIYIIERAANFFFKMLSILCFYYVFVVSILTLDRSSITHLVPAGAVFTPKIGEDVQPFWRSCFSNGLGKNHQLVIL